jgi:hypothetical protein
VYGGVSVGLDWVFFFLGALCCKQAEKKKQCLDFPDAALLNSLVVARDNDFLTF